MENHPGYGPLFRHKRRRNRQGYCHCYGRTPRTGLCSPGRQSYQALKQCRQLGSAFLLSVRLPWTPPACPGVTSWRITSARSQRGKSHKTRNPGSCHQRPGFYLVLIGRLPTLPHTRACSTIGAERLNFRVRDGNGWNPLAVITRKLVFYWANRRSNKILSGLYSY